MQQEWQTVDPDQSSLFVRDLSEKEDFSEKFVACPRNYPSYCLIFMKFYQLLP